MRKLAVKILVMYAVLAQSTFAQISIDQLVAQTGVEESNTAIRDMPRWSGVSKVVFRAGALELDSVRRLYEGVEFVSVRSSSELLREAPTADAYIGECDATFITAAKNLVWTQRTGAGVENCVNIPAIANGDVILTNMQKMASPIIAEHAIAMMMSLARGIPNFARAMDEGSWNRGEQVRSKMTSVVNKKLLVVGLGGIGTEVARFASALGMQVSATRNSSRSGPSFVEYVGLSDELHKLASESDVIISALPLTHATIHLFDNEFFAALKPSAIFISVGRGQSVVTDDLVSALRSGRLAGAGLDVTDPEPLPPGHILWTLPNVIITPHISSGGSERERQSVLLQENLRRFVAGDALLNVVDPAKGY